jgi:hypothetical protein
MLNALGPPRLRTNVKRSALMKKWAIACGLLVGVAVLSLLWILHAPPYRLRVVDQKVHNGRRIAVFRLDARTRRRVNLADVKVYRLNDMGKFLDDLAAPEWFSSDPRGICFKDYAEFAITNCNRLSMSVTVRPEVSARLSFEWIKLACRSRSLGPIRQSWNLNILGRAYLVHCGPVSFPLRGLTSQ